MNKIGKPKRKYVFKVYQEVVAMKAKTIISHLITWGGTLLVIYLFSKDYFEVLTNLLFVIGVIVVSSLVAGYISLGIDKTLEMASEEELKTEDSVLLRGISFLQSTVFIYLNIIAYENIMLSVLKYVIPVFTGAFFIVRGYGSIKRNNKYRFISTAMLTFFFPWEIFVYVIFIMNIPVADVKFWYLFVGFAGVFWAIMNKITEILSTRYGYVKRYQPRRV